VHGSPRLEAADSRSSPAPSRNSETLEPATGERHDDDLAASSESRSSSPDLADLPRVSTSASDDLTFVGANVGLLHANLDSRLRPFWAQPLANRIVRLSLYLQHRDDSEEPLFVQDVLTSPLGGAFNVRFKVPFERICTHPRGVHLAFGGMEQHQHVVLVHAHLLPPPPRQQQVTVKVDSSEEPVPLPPPARIEAEMDIPLGTAGVRVISDIDDTVKSSEVLGGVRSMFRNVFVRPLEQVVIHSMSDWYQAMHSRGVRFHYVVRGLSRRGTFYPSNAHYSRMAHSSCSPSSETSSPSPAFHLVVCDSDTIKRAQCSTGSLGSRQESASALVSWNYLKHSLHPNSSSSVTQASMTLNYMRHLLRTDQARSSPFTFATLPRAAGSLWLTLHRDLGKPWTVL